MQATYEFNFWPSLEAVRFSLHGVRPTVKDKQYILALRSVNGAQNWHDLEGWHISPKLGVPYAYVLAASGEGSLVLPNLKPKFERLKHVAVEFVPWTAERIPEEGICTRIAAQGTVSKGLTMSQESEWK